MEVRQLLTRKRVVARVLTAVCQRGAIGADRSRYDRLRTVLSGVTAP